MEHVRESEIDCIDSCAPNGCEGGNRSVRWSCRNVWRLGLQLGILWLWIGMYGRMCVRLESVTGEGC